MELRFNPVGPHPDLSPPDFPEVNCKEGLRRGPRRGRHHHLFFSAGYWVLGLLRGNPLSCLWAFRRFPNLRAYPAVLFPHPLCPRAQPAGRGAEEAQSSVGWREALPGSPENPGSLHAGTEAQAPSSQAPWLPRLPLPSAHCHTPAVSSAFHTSIPPIFSPTVFLLSPPFCFFSSLSPK